MSTILCLDIGTRMGFAYQCGLEIKGGTKDFSPPSGEAEGWRCAMVEAWLAGVCHRLSPEAIWVEDVRRHEGTHAAHVYGALRGVVAAVAWRRRTPLVAVGVGAIKKHATGKGNATKQLMIAAQQAKGRVVVDDNHADALALLDYARSNPCPPEKSKTKARSKA